MESSKRYYFDNSSTSFPKPKEVIEGVANFIANIGGTYGRVDTPRGKETTLMIEDAREFLSKFLQIKNTNNIVFSSGATRATNDVLNGLNFDGGEVLITHLEHNAVFRPIYQKQKQGILTYKFINSLPDGTVDLKHLKTIINKNTKLVLVNMESNVSGLIQPIKEIKEIIGDIPIFVDGSQGIGHAQILTDDFNIDYLIFTGHKGLLGLTGCGGFYAKNPKTIAGTYFGGGFGDGEETPYKMPEVFEVGTPNTVGLIGLMYALKHRPDWIITKKDVVNTIEKIKSMKYYKVVSASSIDNQGFLFSLVPIKKTVAELGHELNEKFNIETRHGFHCSMLAHNHYANKDGAVRFSFSPYTTLEELNYLLEALDKLL